MAMSVLPFRLSSQVTTRIVVGSLITPVTVTVVAQDQFGNLVVTENRDVTLATSGSATGGGVVDIQNGTGTRDISDTVEETVTLSLSDSALTGLDVSSTVTVDFFMPELLGFTSLVRLAEMVR